MHHGRGEEGARQLQSEGFFPRLLTTFLTSPLIFPRSGLPFEDGLTDSEVNPGRE